MNTRGGRVAKGEGSLISFGVGWGPGGGGGQTFLESHFRTTQNALEDTQKELKNMT